MEVVCTLLIFIAKTKDFNFKKYAKSSSDFGQGKQIMPFKSKTN